MPHRFEIGTKYMSIGKYPRICVVVDQLTVTNAAGAIVKRYYKTAHDVMGQQIFDYEACETTIARGKWNLEHAK